MKAQILRAYGDSRKHADRLQELGRIVPGGGVMIAGPLSKCGAPAANSTTSVTLSTSPMASSHTYSRCRAGSNRHGGV